MTMVNVNTELDELKQEKAKLDAKRTQIAEQIKKLAAELGVKPNLAEVQAKLQETKDSLKESETLLTQYIDEYNAPAEGE